MRATATVLLSPWAFLAARVLEPLLPPAPPDTTRHRRPTITRTRRRFMPRRQPTIMPRRPPTITPRRRPIMLLPHITVRNITITATAEHSARPERQSKTL